MTWDYIIIGAGSAGCALAHELVTGAPQRRVLVLEAGGSDRSPYIRFPAGALHAMRKFDWAYQSQPDPSCNGRSERWYRGRVLGGSSSINSTIFVRGAARDFDRWAERLGPAAASDWSAAAVIPIFRELETSDQMGPARGSSGPLRVTTVRPRHALSQAFIRSARGCGHPFNEDYNGPSQDGVAHAQVSQRRGLRCSAADAFLRPLLGRQKNFTLLLNATVRKIELRNGRADAVSLLHDGRLRRETAGEIILCAGAINSPHLLMLSGIGEAAELERHGIEAAVDLPGVGRNLRDHPLLRLIYRSRIPTYNPTRGVLQKLGFAAAFFLHGEGPIANVFESVAFIKSSPAEPYPDIQLHFEPIGILPDSFELAPYPALSVLVNKSRPSSSGRIRLANQDPAAAPLIECRQLADEADVNTLVAAVSTIRAIMRSEPISSLLAEEIAPSPAVEDGACLRRYVRGHTRTAFHPVGTCRMGTDPDAVVGPDLRVHGIENLWVADASIMPDLISGNTNGACMMIGRKLGKQLLRASPPTRS